MLGKRTPQANFFDSDQQYLHFVGGDTFYGYLAHHRHELFRDEDFASLYCLDNGRTSVPPSILACALILQWYDNVSDEEAAERAKFDVRWKVALGVDLLKAPFAKSVLCEFRNKLIIHKEARKLFEMSLRHARARGYCKSHKITLALDTTPIFGKGAVQDTYNMLAEGLRQVLRVLAQLENKTMEDFASEHDFRRYTAPSFKGTLEIDWDNEAERQAVLESLVADCERMLLEARGALSYYSDSSQEAHRIVEATELLSKLLVQDVKRTAPGTAELVDGVAAERIVSVHDPQMRHGRKSVTQRFNGYKGSLAVDIESQLITAVDVIAASAQDSHNTDVLIKQTEQATKATVDTVIGDGAYGTIETRLDAQETSHRLIAPVAQPPRTGRFSKNDFVISSDHSTITCPAGHTTTRWFSGTQRTKRGGAFALKKFTFSQRYCGSCPLRHKCLSPRTPFRTVTVHEHEAMLQQAKEFQRTELFRQLYRKRVVVEHRIARLVQLGLRKARYFGSAKVLFQLAMTAAVANLTLTAASPLFFALLLLLSVLLTTDLISNSSKYQYDRISCIHRLRWFITMLTPEKSGGLRPSF